MYKRVCAMAFNRKSILNMQLPTESGWDSTASIHEKNVIHGQSCYVFWPWEMNGISYYGKEKSSTFSQLCGAGFAHSIATL